MSVTGAGTVVMYELHVIPRFHRRVDVMLIGLCLTNGRENERERVSKVFLSRIGYKMYDQVSVSSED